MLLAGNAVGEVVGVLVALMIAGFFHQFGGGVADVQRWGEVHPALLQDFVSFFYYLTKLGTDRRPIENIHHNRQIRKGQSVF